MFMEVGRPDTKDATFAIERVNGGGYDPSHPGYETNVNMQYAQAMAYPTPHIFYSTGGSMKYPPSSNELSSGDMFLKWFNYLLAEPNIPQTISTPFGADEKDVPRGYATSVCNLFVQLGARGVSVLFASADDGVGAGDCKVDGKVQFIPMYVTSCTCGVLSLLATSIQPHAQVAYHIATVSQVLGSLASVARRNWTPRLPRASPGRLLVLLSPP